MKKSQKSKIPRHRETSFTEKQSISLIQYILTTHGRVMPKLYSIDKWPNIDGHLEVQDSEGNLVGRLYVQVKTFPLDHSYRLSIPISFLSSCEIDSILLFGVDRQNKKVYWRYCDSQTIKKIDFKINNDFTTITFDSNKFFDENTSDYIGEWEKIIKNNQFRLQNFDALSNAYKIILESSNAVLGKVNNDFVRIHDFLDTFNGLLDREFSIVKTLFYPRTWNIGIAYYEYKPSKLSYALYPIYLDKNDVQIKEVDKDLQDKIQKEGLEFTVHFVENPIETRPKEYAKEIIQSKVFKLLENKLLSHAGNNFLAREFIFAFIDKFHVQLGLAKKDTYTIHEIEKAFYQYLPLWVEEAANFMISVKRNGKNELTDCLTVDRLRGGQPYFDPDSMIREIMEDERKEIEDKVKARLKDRQVKIPNWPISNQKLPLDVFVELFTYLKNTQDEITRLYKPKDFHRLKNSWVWEVFSKNAAEQNLKLFFENLSSVYETILENNFPILKNELSLFSKADKIIITFAVKDEYKSFQDIPTYKMFYLQSENKNVERSIEVLTNKPAEEFNNFDWKKREIEHQKNKYKVVSIRSSILNFIYEDTPLLDFVYDLLDDRLKEYFRIKDCISREMIKI